MYANSVEKYLSRSRASKFGFYCDREVKQMIECKDCKHDDNCPDRVAKLAMADSPTRAVWSVWELSRNGANKFEKHGEGE